MTKSLQPTDLELVALISSKICHDAIGPVGAIYNGIEILDEEDDPQSQAYAMDVIRNVTQQASSRIQFARFAFGAAGSAGAKIDLSTAQQISQGYVGDTKHKLSWSGPHAHMGKDYVKLLLNLISCSITTLPRGGQLAVQIEGDVERPSFAIRCSGKAARPPQYLTDFIIGKDLPELDAMTIQAYYTWRLASTTRMKLEILQDGEDIILAAKPVG